MQAFFPIVSLHKARKIFVAGKRVGRNRVVSVSALFFTDFKPLVDGLRHGPNRTICDPVPLAGLPALDKRERLLPGGEGGEGIA